MSAPDASVVVPAYESHRTIAACLEALRRQTFAAFETVVVDSSPGSESERIVRGAFPDVRYEHVPQRLLPHAARNRGAERARSDLLVFTDPDVYAEPRWLEALVGSHRASGHITVGAIACHGRRWLDVGNHLCKFAKWLPGGQARSVDMSPTANMLCPRRVFVELGGFPGEHLLGDTSFSWRARRLGHELWFDPRAIVSHHHTQNFRELLGERYRRGAMFGQLRADWYGNRRALSLLYLLVSLLPIRLARILMLTAAHCRRAGHLFDLVSTLPVVTLGHSAWLAGECRTYARLLVRLPDSTAE